MYRKRPRVYQPSETHLALYPATVMVTCRCGTRFQQRPESRDTEDDPDLCLTCNRAHWSRLWNDNKPIDNLGAVDTMKAPVPVSASVSIDHDIIAADDLSFDLTGDDDDDVSVM